MDVEEQRSYFHAVRLARKRGFDLDEYLYGWQRVITHWPHWAVEIPYLFWPDGSPITVFQVFPQELSCDMWGLINVLITLEDHLTEQGKDHQSKRLTRIEKVEMATIIRQYLAYFS